MSLQVGQQAPDFTLPADDGSVFKLAGLKGKRVLVVFYPGDATPVCTAQLCEYSEGLAEFEGLNCEVVAISADDEASHVAFKQKQGLKFPLLVDRDLAVAKKFGATGLMGLKRACFLLDETLVVRYAHVETLALFRRSREELVAALKAMDRA
jgi:peroxiredoxin Q/BCP